MIVAAHLDMFDLLFVDIPGPLKPNVSFSQRHIFLNFSKLSCRSPFLASGGGKNRGFTVLLMGRSFNLKFSEIQNLNQPQQSTLKVEIINASSDFWGVGFPPNF